MSKIAKTIRGELENILGGRRRKEVMSDALDFAEKHPDVVVFIADKRTDDIIAVYNSHYSAVRIRSKLLNGYTGVIDGMLYEEAGRERQKKLSEFLGVVDAFFWNLSEKLINEKKDKVEQKKVEKEKKKLLKEFKKYAEKKESGEEESGREENAGEEKERSEKES